MNEKKKSVEERIDQFIDNFIIELINTLEQHIYNEQKFTTSIKESLKNEICYDLFKINEAFIECYEKEQNKQQCAEKLYLLLKNILS